MRNIKEDSAVANQLRSYRVRLGLSQQEVARHAGVTRQTISGLEGGQYAPSAAVALRLSRAMNCRVEDLFWLEDDFPTVTAVTPAAFPPIPLRQESVSVAKIGSQYVVHSLRGEAAFLEQLRPADGILQTDGDSDTSAAKTVQLLGSVEQIEKTVAIAGCAPALTLWARSAEQWYPGLRTLCLHANSTEALLALRRGEVHIAGTHIQDPKTGVRDIFGQTTKSDFDNIVLIQLGTWEEGFVVAAGNPKGIRCTDDIAGNPNCRLVNRETGSGARRLLDSLLEKGGTLAAAIAGYENVVRSHAAVARTVAANAADVGVTTSGLAAIFGLDFIPLQETRYDLAVRREYLDHEPVRQLLATLDHRWVRKQLKLSGGFDTSGTGEIMVEM